MSDPRQFTQQEINALPDNWQRVLDVPSFMRMDEVGISCEAARQRVAELRETGMNPDAAVQQVILEHYYDET